MRVGVVQAHRGLDQVVNALEVAERPDEENDGSPRGAARAPVASTGARMPPRGVDPLIVHAQAPPLRPRRQRHVRQIARHGQKPMRTAEGCPAVEVIPRRPRAPPKPAVGVCTVHGHHERGTRVAGSSHGRKRPRRLMLVDHFGLPLRDCPAHRAQPPRLGDQADRPRGAERPRGGFPDRDNDAGIPHASSQRERLPRQIGHRGRVCERKVGGGDEQRSLRQGNLHGRPHGGGAGTGMGMHPS